ncbi:MAG: hypothetical protein ACE145_19585 [Terriglobia bacterium]
MDFIVVGGVAGAAHGGNISTFDLDIVHSREAGNLERLMKALRVLDARYRTPGHKDLQPTHWHLASPGHQLLMTTFGPLDVLGAVGKEHEYDDLLAESIEMDIGESAKVRVLDLEALIRIKGETAKEKDMAQLAILRRLLEEKSRK